MPVFCYVSLMQTFTHLYRSSRTPFAAIGIGECGDLSG